MNQYLFANVVAERNGTQDGGAQTDFDGNYTIKPLTPGEYTVRASFVGKQPAQINGVIVSIDKITYQDVKLKSGNVDLNVIQISDYAIPLIKKVVLLFKLQLLLKKLKVHQCETLLL